MHQLSPSETALLSSETNTNLGHQSLVLELAPDADGEHLQLSGLRAVIEQSMHRAPSLRRRVRHVPLELDDPWWIEDPHFDLDYHIRHLAVPGASDPDALEQLLARLHERPLDRNRPLWELYLIENPDGATNLFVKVHIVLIEELGPLGPLSPVLARLGTELDDPANGTWRPDMLPTDSDLLIKAAWSIMRSPMRTGRHLLEVYRRVPVVGEVARMALAISNSALHPVERARNDRPVPRVSFNRTVGAHRRVARVTLSVDRLREIRRQRGVRFHDVLLTVISGALRNWLVLNDELPSEPLVALTPLLVDADSDELGAALVPIATHRHDPLQRLDDISASMSELTLELEPQSASRSPIVSARRRRWPARVTSAADHRRRAAHDAAVQRLRREHPRPRRGAGRRPRDRSRTRDVPDHRRDRSVGQRDLPRPPCRHHARRRPRSDRRPRWLASGSRSNSTCCTTSARRPSLPDSRPQERPQSSERVGQSVRYMPTETSGSRRASTAASSSIGDSPHESRRAQYSSGAGGA